MRVVLAEDSTLLREGVARLLSDAGFEVCGTCGTGDELLDLVASMAPDVAVVDVRMPPTHTDEGLRAAQALRARWPGTGVLILSQYVEVGLAAQLLAAGAERLGYLLKDRITDIEQFIEAVRRVGEGGSSLDPTVVSLLLARRQGDDDLGRLTPREREVLGLMAEGLSNQAIATRIVTSRRAVEKHVTAIFEKLGLSPTDDVHRRVVAVLRYFGVRPT